MRGKQSPWDNSETTEDNVQAYTANEALHIVFSHTMMNMTVTLLNAGSFFTSAVQSVDALTSNIQ